MSSKLHLRDDVILGVVRAEYAPAMYQWMLDPQIHQNLGLRHEPSLARTQDWIERAQHDSQIHPFAVLWNNEHVGNIVFDHIDTFLSTARFSIYIGQANARNVGVGTTAMYLAFQQAFDEMCLHKVWLTVHARNIAAINTYVRFGFTLEGILRDEFVLENQRTNALYMGLLAREFQQIDAG